VLDHEADPSAFETITNDKTMNDTPTPETDALYRDDHRPNLIGHARKLERERDKAIAALSAIEERYIDGCDTYEDYKFMGITAREFFFPPNA
jgi:hypothetical protein